MKHSRYSRNPCAMGVSRGGGAGVAPPPSRCSQRNSGNRTSEDALTFFFGSSLDFGGVNWTSEDVKTFFFGLYRYFQWKLVNRKLWPPFSNFWARPCMCVNLTY